LSGRGRWGESVCDEDCVVECAGVRWVGEEKGNQGVGKGKGAFRVVHSRNKVAIDR